MMLPLERIWVESLDKFMSAYSVAAESAMGVPQEIYAIAPIAAKFLLKYSEEFPPSAITKILAERPAVTSAQRD